MSYQAEYIWIDGPSLTLLRSKTKIVPRRGAGHLGFDGSSTKGDRQRLGLRALAGFVADPCGPRRQSVIEVSHDFTRPTHRQVLRRPRSSPTKSPGRHRQEYTFLRRRPYMWPRRGTDPAPTTRLRRRQDSRPGHRRAHTKLHGRRARIEGTNAEVRWASGVPDRDSRRPRHRRQLWWPAGCSFSARETSGSSPRSSPSPSSVTGTGRAHTTYRQRPCAPRAGTPHRGCEAREERERHV